MHSLAPQQSQALATAGESKYALSTRCRCFSAPCMHSIMPEGLQTAQRALWSWLQQHCCARRAGLPTSHRRIGRHCMSTTTKCTVHTGTMLPSQRERADTGQAVTPSRLSLHTQQHVVSRYHDFKISSTHRITSSPLPLPAKTRNKLDSCAHRPYTISFCLCHHLPPPPHATSATFHAQLLNSAPNHSERVCSAPPATAAGSLRSHS